MPDLTGNFDTGKLPKIAPGTITVTIARRIDPASKREFLAWCDDMMTAVRAAEGCLGATVLEPAKKNDPYHMVFRFSDALMLRQWERSEVRQQLRERADNLVVSEKVTVTAGSEEFFNALGDVEGHRTKWGKFVADVAWIYPVSLFTAIVLSPYIGKLDVFPRVLVSSVIVGATSKYATGPVRKWLRRRRMLPQGAEVK